MPEHRLVLAPILTLTAIAIYHEDIMGSLRLYFSEVAPTFNTRFFAQTLREVADDLESRLDESDVRSALAVSASLETSFRIVFDYRCRNRTKDTLTTYFRQVKKTRGDRIRLDEDILERWKPHTTAPNQLISELRGAFKFRHWIAHGRYWVPKFGRKYDFVSVYLLASAVSSAIPFKP